jgi:hypothetical protein
VANEIADWQFAFKTFSAMSARKASVWLAEG